MKDEEYFIVQINIDKMLYHCLLIQTSLKIVTGQPVLRDRSHSNKSIRLDTERGTILSQTGAGPTAALLVKQIPQWS